MSDTTAIEIRTAAKQRALKIIEANPGCTSYVRPEDLDTQSLFVPVVSVIKPTPEDFYPPIPEVGIMGKPPLVNLIREKAGVEILRTETSKRGEWIWHAHVYGEKRQPDGTMLRGDASYEFDVEKRCELDFINQPDKYNTDIAKRKHILKTARFGEQRAVTGAQHALIHKLAHVARSFKTAAELTRGMIVCRIDRNIDGMLADPEMKRLAMNQAIGVTEQLYGPGKTLAITAEPETMTPDVPPAAEPAKAAPARKIDIDTGEITEQPKPGPVEEGQAPLFEDDLPWEEKSPAEQLIDLLKSCSPRNQEQGMKWLASKPPEAEIIAKIKTVNAAFDKAAAEKGGAS